MLDALSRRMVEIVKTAKVIHITVSGGGIDDEGLTLHFDNRRKSIKKLSHDIALALQDYMNKPRNDTFQNGNNYQSL